MDLGVELAKGKDIASSAVNGAVSCGRKLAASVRAGTRTRMVLLPLWTCALFAVLVAGVVPVFTTYRDALPNRTQPTIVPVYDNTLITYHAAFEDNSSFVAVKTKVSDVNVLSNALKLSVDVVPAGRYNTASSITLNGLADGCTLQLRISGVLLTYENGASLNHLEVSVFINELVPPAMYPLDVYETRLTMMLSEVCTIANSTNQNSTTTKAVPLLWFAYNTYPQFSFTPMQDAEVTFNSTSRSAHGTVSEASIGLTIERSGQSIAASFIITVLSWLMSGFLLVMVIDHTLVRPRTAVPALLGPSVTMLFALPTIRNAQPGIPAMGIAIDLVGLYWNLSMVCVAVLLLLAHHMADYKHRTPSS